MSANTDTTGADRTKCKAFCGWRYFDMKTGSVPFESWARSAAWPGPAKDDTVFCSQNCHDARLPPIAAPAAHVERRKVEVGQRRRSHDRTYTVFAIEHRCAFVCQDGDLDSIDGYVHNGGCCWESVSVLEDCELLADATPEAAKRRQKALACDHCQAMQEVETDCDAVMCAVCFAAGHSLRDKSTPVQEAPKAAPVCAGQGKLHQGAALERYVKNIGTGYVEHRRLCDACHLWHERQFIELTAPRSTGKPYAGPERLPRPRLAADWVEDCLPESAR